MGRSMAGDIIGMIIPTEMVNIGATHINTTGSTIDLSMIQIEQSHEITMINNGGKTGSMNGTMGLKDVGVN